METLIKNLHTFVSIAMEKSCTELATNIKTIDCDFEGGNWPCAQCAFETPNTKGALSVIKIIGEHSERTD